MGAYYLIVNPVKRQYFDPHWFGEAIKFSSFLCGGRSLLVLKLLISDRFRRDHRSFPGAWLGDPVIFAGDDSGLPNPGGIPTGTDRNLHAVAKDEYVDISYRALAELCRDSRRCREMAAEAIRDETLLVSLGGVLDQYPNPGLAEALTQEFGEPWRKVYHQALARTCIAPLPPIDWPL